MSSRNSYILVPTSMVAAEGHAEGEDEQEYALFH